MNKHGLRQLALEEGNKYWALMQASVLLHKQIK